MVLSQDLNDYNKYLEISSYAVYLGISPKNFRIMVMHGLLKSFKLLIKCLK
jgi:hypothetical protein